MDVRAPSEEELSELLAKHAARAPEKASLVVLGDGGTPIKLPLVLGNPSGATLEAKPDAKKPSVWARFLAVALKLRPEPLDLPDAVALDGVLWPPRRTWFAWCERWPALAKTVADSIATKVGCSLQQAAYDDEPPEPLAPILAEHPRATWREVRTRDGLYALAIEPLDATAWPLFTDKLKKPDEHDTWSLARELCDAVIIGCVERKRSGEDVAFDKARLLSKSPGIAIVVIGEVAQLVGVSAEVHLGEW